MPKETYVLPFGQTTPEDASVATIYTVGNRNKSVRHAVLTHISAINLTGAERDISIYVDNDGGTDWGTGKAIVYQTPLAANQLMAIDCRINLKEDATIGVQCDAGNAVNFTLSGEEVVER